MEIIGQVEIDDYCQKILKLRWPDVPKWRDIHEVKGQEITKKIGALDLISGGFPCQLHSLAGKRKSETDDRNLWPEMSRIISEIKPPMVLAENVPGVLGFAEQFILPDLENQGYETITIIFPAHAIGAPHRRERVWIVAYSGYLCGRNIGSFEERTKISQERSADYSKACRSSEQSQNVADPNSFDWRKGIKEKAWKKINNNCWWAIEPNVGRVAHGMPNRVDRLKMLGNGQVVQVVEWIGKRIMDFYMAGGWEKSP